MQFVRRDPLMGERQVRMEGISPDSGDINADNESERDWRRLLGAASADKPPSCA